MSEYEYWRLVGMFGLFAIALMGVFWKAFSWVVTVERKLSADKRRLDEHAEYMVRNVPDLIAENASHACDLARLYAKLDMAPPHIDHNRRSRLDGSLKKITGALPVVQDETCQTTSE